MIGNSSYFVRRRVEVDSEATKKGNSLLKLKYIQKPSNVRDRHGKQKEGYCKNLGAHTIERCTYGLASNINIQGSQCKAMEFVVEDKKTKNYRKQLVTCVNARLT